MKREGDGYVGGPAAGEGEWDADNLKAPAKPAKPKRTTVSVDMGGVKIVVDKTGVCEKCGEDIMRAQGGLWFHKGYAKGKRYAHEARPERRTRGV